jgi:A/G-specific adenine glycosylase
MTALSQSNPPDAKWKRQFQRRLMAWFARYKRDLPWRKNGDAYRVWLSEIMLQQTQVATVIPYFERFLAAFPTVKDLAAADEREVLRLWEGLGYYRRARQLHAAARKVVAEHGGKFPSNFEAIRNLPGIGRYTAGAIASIAFDLPTPILEANTVRLFSRLIAYRGDQTSTTGQRALWNFAEHILPNVETGNFNQALMELGSLICTPRTPNCEECPVSALCQAREAGLQEQIPAIKRKLKFEDAHEAAIVIRRGTKVLLRERPHGERWAGLWDFVRFPILARRNRELHPEIERKVHEQVGMKVSIGPRLTTLKHGVTRFRITLDCYTAEHLSGLSKKHDGAALHWVKPSGLAEYPLSVTARKLATLLNSLC